MKRPALRSLAPNHPPCVVLHADHKRLAVDSRPRVTLSDAEFAELVTCAQISEHIRLRALVSRCFGGMRTSDLHGWAWSLVDTNAWQSAEVYHPKTDGPKAPLEL